MEYETKDVKAKSTSEAKVAPAAAKFVQPGPGAEFFTIMDVDGNKYEQFATMAEAEAALAAGS
tara:strand:+ start:969 stop:1157 length:189 start_codon:yes stop_codon:yes gene_type:complete